MLTRTRFQELCDLQPVPQTSFKKGDTIMLSGKSYFIMAKLQADQDHTVTYNICSEELLNPRFGVNLDTAELIPTAALSEKIRNRAKNFL